MKFLRDFLIVEADIDDEAGEKLAFRGEIHKSYIVSKRMILTQEDFEGVYTELPADD